MRLRLGRIPYLNTEPFFSDDEIRTQAAAEVPRRMIELALRGSVDLAPLPIVAIFDHPDMFRAVGQVGIATTGAARSVLLLSQVPIDQLNGARIGVIDETATSVRLLKVLLQFRFEVEGVTLTDLASTASAILLIGDRAMVDRPDHAVFPYAIDLAAEWHEWTRLPFVFAAWMVRRGIVAEACQSVLEYFDSNLNRNLDDPKLIHARRPDLGLSLDEIETYLKTFQYRFDDETWAGMERFQELDARVSLAERVA